MTLTVTLSRETWVVLAILVLVAGKSLQQGGVLYGRGQRWEWVTIPGAMLQACAIIAVGLALFIQNAN